MNRITPPAVSKKASRQSTSTLNQIGNKLQYDIEMTNAPISNLSAIGSKNVPSLLACDGHVRAIAPSA